MYSASKTFTASAIGQAIGEGRLALDDRVCDLLPEVAALVAGSSAAGASGVSGAGGASTELTVHHLLSMSTGHDADTLPEMEVVAPADWARTFLSIRPQARVGSRHVYNNGASWLLGEVIRTRTGEDLLAYLRPRLLEPLGIDATWDRDAVGRCLGWSGLHLRTRDLAAIGELYRCDGVWRGRRLLPEGWVARATTAQIPTLEPNPDWCFGYGYQLWLGREGYRLDGAYGQFSLVLPERGLVIAITSAQSATQVLLDLVWDVLLPGLEAVPTAALGATGQDAAELAGEQYRVATLPVPTDTGLGTCWSASGVVQLDASLVASPDEQTNLPELRDANARRDGDGFRVGFTTNGQAVELIGGSGTWVRQQMLLGDVAIPVAAAAGSAADGALDVRLVFTDSPHTLRLRLVGDTAGMAWGTPPLQGGDLAGLVAR